MTQPIGIFDSGMGGLTVYLKIKEALPQYDFLYLGDHARAPYGGRSFETIYEYTLNAVEFLFAQGCPLVILACNTASARALRTIQQEYLPMHFPDRRVLGVIRPMTEFLAETSGDQIGILATPGTVRSNSYGIELDKLCPQKKVAQVSCPLLVPLIENNELESPPLDYFIDKYINELVGIMPEIKNLVLGCTHYPMIKEKIQLKLPEVKVLEHGPIVASKLVEYLSHHPEIEQQLSKKSSERFCTTDDAELFSSLSQRLLGPTIQWERVHL